MTGMPDHRRHALPTDHDVASFAEELMRSGVMLCDLFEDLHDAIPPGAYPGECPSQVLLEMFAGSMRPVADAAGARAVREATALLGGVGDRVLADLRAAMELSRER